MFKTPLTKIAKCLLRSRAGWKAKCQRAKCANKRLATQNRAVEKSRDYWKQKAKAANQQQRVLERELEELKSTARL